MKGKAHKPPSRTTTAPRTREQVLADLATRQHGVITRQQLFELGLTRKAVDSRLQSGRLHTLHQGVYALGHERLSRNGRWLAAVLAHGDGALLSHRSAAALWSLTGAPTQPVDVTSPHGRPGRQGIRLHRARLHPDDCAHHAAIPVTSVSRTLLDYAEVVDEHGLRRAFEEADRLHLLHLADLEETCDRGRGRRGLGKVQRLLREAQRTTTTRSPLEDRFAAFCRAHRLPPPSTNVSLLGSEVDAFWPEARLVVELDGFAYHHHRTAFEQDRARDTALQAAGYRVLRLTHRRLEDDSATVASQIRRLLASRNGSGDAPTNHGGPEAAYIQ